MFKHKLILCFLLLLGINNLVLSAKSIGVENNKHIISKRLHCIKPGESFLLEAAWANRLKEHHKVSWISTNTNIIALEDINRNTVTIKAVDVGQCDVKLYLDRREVGNCRFVVDTDGVIKILAIGNSFSEDALEQYMYPILVEEGVEAIVANMYIPGCSLETHWRNANGNRADYSYRKIVAGKKNITDKYSIQKAINDENWDFISFQQASHFSGLYSTYVDYLPPLVDYVKIYNKSAHTSYVLHQTWSYAWDSNHNGFLNYSNDQLKMFYQIILAVEKAASLVDIETIVPAGTAIQNGRTSSLSDSFNLDGYHLNCDIGRYTASCTWVVKLLGFNVLGSNYIPSNLTYNEVLISQLSALKAVSKPSIISSIPF